MASKMKVRRSSLFLLELMITILLFSVNSAVCIRIFAEAHNASRQAQLLTDAAGVCSNAAEAVRSADSPEQIAENITGQFESCIADGDTLQIERENGSRVEVSQQMQEDMDHVQIRYLDRDDSCVYKLEVLRYFPEVVE